MAAKEKTDKKRIKSISMGLYSFFCIITIFYELTRIVSPGLVGSPVIIFVRLKPYQFSQAFTFFISIEKGIVLPSLTELVQVPEYLLFEKTPSNIPVCLPS